MRAKVCGITNYDDAMTAIDAGADALGFVFYPPSPRYIEPERAAEIIHKLPPFVEKVGLFVNWDAPAVNDTCRLTGATLAQIHFDPSPEFYEALTVPHLKVIRAKCAEDLDQHVDEYRLVDAFVEEYGGAGKRLPMEWFENRDCSKMILAGGLTAEIVRSVRSYGFYGVDASSALEQSRGIKEPALVRAFVAAAKS